MIGSRSAIIPHPLAMTSSAYPGRIVSICRPLGVRVAVNDRIDVGLAVGADAVQLGSRSLPIAVAKRIAGPLQIGASVHSSSEAAEAESDGADWITFGHFFPTSSHPSEPCRDIAELKIVARRGQNFGHRDRRNRGRSSGPGAWGRSRWNRGDFGNS